MSNRDRTLLIVEDNEDDFLLFSRAVTKAGLECQIQWVDDGEKAIDYARGRGGYQDRSRFPKPAVILLDLKLPKKNGLEVLEAIRRDPTLNEVVVIVLTSSQENSDVAGAYRHLANAYLVKPAAFPDLIEVLRAIQSFWFRHNIFAT